MESERHSLLALLAKYAFQYNPNGFTLSSGAKSYEYIDCKQALSHPKALALLGNVFLTRLSPRVVAIGGLTMGADPIAISTAQASAGSHNPVRWFCVWKENKSHGLRCAIEGPINPGESVAVVDDVVTSGASTIYAIKQCRKYGLNVAQVIVLIDREVGGLASIRRVVGDDVMVTTVFTKSEVREKWESQER